MPKTVSNNEFEIRAFHQIIGRGFAKCVSCCASLLVSLLMTGSAASQSAVYPTGSIYAAGTVDVSPVRSDRVAGGYFGNGRGKTLDFAVTNATGSGPVLTTYNGNGDGTFNSTNYSFTGSGIKSGLATIYSGPVTGAGRVDLVTTTLTFNGSANLSTVTFLFNDGSGNFTPQTLLSASAFPVTEVDYLNIGGTPSLLLLGSNGLAEISTFSNGFFGAPASFNLNLPPGTGPLSGVVSYVLNGNTSFAGLASGRVWTYSGNPDGSFQPPTGFIFPPYLPVQVAAADLNGDGIADLVALYGGQFTDAQTVLPLYGDAAGHFHFGFKTGPGVYGAALAIGDVNCDGHPDVLLTEASQGISVLLNQGDGTFPHPNSYAAPQTVNGAQVPDHPTAIATIDINRDGIPDIVVANGLNYDTEVNTNTISSFVGDGHGQFSYTGDTAVGKQPVGLAVAKDGSNVDAFVINAINGNVDCLQANGNESFTSIGTFTGAKLTSGQGAVAIAAGAIGPAGAVGVVVADGKGGINVFIKSGNTFAETANYSTATNTSPTTFGAGVSSITLTDINGDGKPDLLVALEATGGYDSSFNNVVYNGSVLVFPGVGDGTFGTLVSVTASQANWSPGFVTAGSLTGGSILDLVVVNNPQCSACTLAGTPASAKTIAIFSGSSLANMVETDLASPLDGIASQRSFQIPLETAAVADANNDGINDLILSYGGWSECFLVRDRCSSVRPQCRSRPRIRPGS